MSGRLFIIATPIGNLSDLSGRAKESLENADIVLVEDTRVTIKLINHLGLKKKLTSCHEYNESKRKALIKEVAANNGTVAVVSDAGMPLVSDPGYQIVQAAIEEDMQVIPIPGPSAFLLALVGSGLACDRFVFEGFLPDRLKTRRKKLESLKDEPRTIIFYVAPHDLMACLQLCESTLGNRRACLAREITKLHEEFIRGSLSEIISVIRDKGIKGEYVLVLEGAPEAPEREISDNDLAEEIQKRLKEGQSLKEASKAMAEEFGRKSSDIYRIGLNYMDQ